MVQKYIIDKADIHNLLIGKDIPLEHGSKARAFCVEIAGGMTNGEVIQAMFPNSKTETISFNGIRLYIDDEVHTKIADFAHRWWNAPYKAESEEDH